MEDSTSQEGVPVEETEGEVEGEVEGVPPEGETITEIQNYLASFNKEIQDGAPGAAAVTEGTILAASEGDEDAEGQTTTTTYYVAQAPDGTTYQYAEGETPFEGATYYTTSGEAYFATTEEPAEGESVAEGQEYEEQAKNSEVDEEEEQEEMVMTVTEEPEAPIVPEPREISVTIPASMGVSETTEKLLHAVKNQRAQGRPATKFVAMQPDEDAGEGENDGEVEEVQVAKQEIEDEVQEEEEIQHQIMPQHQTIRMLVRQPDGTETEQTIPVTGPGGSTLLTSDGQEIHVSDEGTLQMMASLAEQAAAGGGDDGNNQVILNTGSAYQTVTIVPSDTNPGEVSYVLIVSQPEEDKDKEVNLDMSVYDFNEGVEKHGGELMNQEPVPEPNNNYKMKTIKITPKKSQTVTQAHMCNYCNYTSPKRYLLSRHMKSHSEERPHKCSVCERGFKTLASLQNHVNTHTGTRPHHCKECTAAFTTSGELVRHVRYKHTHEKPHRCTECDYASVELSKLKRHMRCHTGERPYQCPHCTYASPDTYKLKRHLRIHTGEKPYECDICHARFTQSNSLKAHKLIHSGNKPVFQCELCPTTCGRKTDLRIHVQKLHTSDKPLKCKRCGKSFPDRYTYKVHVKTHEGEKCFKCDLCAYASISQRHLESHMLIHTDQKPYRCDECGQSFRQKQLLKRHKNLYHDPNYIPPIPKEKTHECPECGKTFRHKGNLIRHLAVHDPDATAAEKEEAMRIGRPKAPGEEHDGEEDEEYLDEEEDLDHLSMEDDEAGMNDDGNEGQQVVVFEVIQLPATEGNDDQQNLENAAAMAMAAANGQSADGVTIIQQVSSIGNAGSQVITPSQSSVGDSVAAQPVLMSQPRKRGRPRKYPITSEMGSPTSNVISLPDRESRPIRKRKERSFRDAEMDDDDPDFVITPKRGRPRVLRAIKRHIDDDEEEYMMMEERIMNEPATIIITDPEEIARREEEMMRKSNEQKEKDMAECFGFNDEDDDEDETMMSQSMELNGPVNGDNDQEDYT